MQPHPTDHHAPEKKEIQELPKALRAKKADLSDWYHQILFLADVVDIRYNIKGMNVWKSWGYETMLRIKRFWDEMFKDSGIMELYFPQIIPIEYCEQNPDWWAGFKDEGFKVIAGDDNAIQGALRPTGEAAMYPMYSMWIRSQNDLPFRAYETVSSFRYETAHTRPLIRDREITLWHEIHTVHATKEESLEEAQLHLQFYRKLWDFVAMSPIIADKPRWEVFPGAVGGIEFYNITSDGKAMENGSINILGQAYAKKFNITFKDKDGAVQHAWQVCTGNGARLLAGAIIQHGDDKGLVLPPTIAPYQAVIVPIIFEKQKEQVLAAAKEMLSELKRVGIRVHLDAREETAGVKFYDWEIKGVPVRVEIGPKDIAAGQVTLVKRNDGKKIQVPWKEAGAKIDELLATIQGELLAKSQRETKERIHNADSMQKLGEVLDNGKTGKVHWCGEGICYDKIKEVREGGEIFGSDYFEKKKGVCVSCGKETETLAYVAKTY